jgi:conjugative transfer signal peptidase TraF
MVRLHAPPAQVKPRTLLATLLGCLAIFSSTAAPQHRSLVVNLSASVPLGLYARSAAQARVGHVVLIRLPMTLRQLAARRGYLPFDRLLIKRIAAGPGDVVCRLGSRVWAGGHSQAWALRTDSLGRPLRYWSGCRRLRASELFVLGTHLNSFDSRYFGPINRQPVLTVVRPILTFRL